MVLPCRVTPVLYPATCARYHSPIRYSRQTTNPKRSSYIQQLVPDIIRQSDTVVRQPIQNVVVLRIGGGVNRLQVDTLVLKSLDALDETLPVCIEPLLVRSKGSR